MKADTDSIRLTLSKLRGLAFLIRHFDVGAALSSEEAEGIGALLDDVADEFEAESE